jgi:C1A family cysteine protease
VQPPAGCYQEAVNNRVLSYQRVPQTLTSLKACLAHGYPIVFGFQVYETFESQQVAATGVVPLPGTGEQLLGGHAVLAVGYDDTATRFLVRNSWGPGWGQGGYFTMPYLYLTERDLSNDFWAVLQVA